MAEIAHFVLKNCTFRFRDYKYFKYKVFGLCALRLYDGSYVNISAPFVIQNKTENRMLFLSSGDNPSSQRYSFEWTSVYVNTASIKIELKKNGLDSIIAGVDVFLTKSEVFMDVDKKYTAQSVNGETVGEAYDDGRIVFDFFDTDKVYERFDKLVFYRSVSIDKTQFGKDMQLIPVQGVETALSMADLRNYNIGGNAATIYNSRLHIAAANTYINGKALPMTLEPLDKGKDDNGNTIWEYGQLIDAVFQAKANNRSFSLLTKLPWPLPYIISLPVSGVSDAVLFLNIPEEFLGHNYLRIPLSFHSSNSFNMSLYTYFSSVTGDFTTYPLGKTELSTEDEYTAAYSEAQSTVLVSSSPSLIKVSEVDNPLVFPAKNSVQVGSSTVKALAANTHPISEGQFGAAPLYAFTDEGVWMLMTDSDGGYQARQPVNREICTNTSGILFTEDAVFYPSSKGIIMQQGRTSLCITDAIDTDTPFSFPDFSSAHAAATVLNVCGIANGNVTHVPFRQFLKGADMIYSYYDSRIILFNPNYLYAYVFSMRSRHWATIPNTFQSRVNIYPEAYAVNNQGIIVDVKQQFASNGTITPFTDVPYLLCTRPLAISSPDVLKSLQALIVRGLFPVSKNDRCATVVYASNDLFSWFPVYSSRSSRLRGLAGSPYKYFRIVCTGHLDQGQTISGATVQFAEQRRNKLR